MCEPLIFSFCFPFCRFKPWQVCGILKLFELERTVQVMWKGSRVDRRSNLRQFLVAAWKLSTIPDDVVQYVLYFEPRSGISCEEAAGR